MKRFIFVLFLLTQSLHSQWVQTGLTKEDVTAFAVSGNNFFAGTSNHGGFPGGGVFRSTDDGMTWSAVNSGLPKWDTAHYCSVYALAFAGTNLFTSMVDYAANVYRSTDNGFSWSRADSGLPKPIGINSFAVVDTCLFAAAPYLGTDMDWETGIFLTTNNAKSWTRADSGVPAYTAFLNLSAGSNGVGGTTLLAGSDNDGVYLSANNGTSWTKVNSGLPKHTFDTSIYLNVSALAVNGANLHAAFWYGGIFRSTNNGANWMAVNSGLPQNITVNEFAIRDANIFAGTNSGVFLSTNNGTNWNSVNTGLTNTLEIGSLVATSTHLFAGTNGAGVWRRPLFEMIPTSVEQIFAQLPERFDLQQNYPNPFNPSTTIRYSLPSTAHVKLTIYNMLGQAVSELVNEQQSAGWREVRWDAKSISSGVYFYELRAGSFVQTRKMLVLK